VSKNTIIINGNDNVAVVLEETSGIKPGHKMALGSIKKGESVIKYGSPIGRATADIAEGEFVHSHNLKTNLGGIEEYSYAPAFDDLVESCPPRYFSGYERKNGTVGIRNEIWIINTVGCVNKIAEKVVQKASELYLPNEGIDGIHTFVHPYGCSQLGDDHCFTQQILANMVNHPNAGGVLVLGLGCENNLIGDFKKVIGERDENRVKFLNTQDTEDEISEAIKLIGELTQYAETFKRKQIPVSKLTIGLKCGGSDGFSGITANPLAGKLCDTLIAHGGTCILTEVPEMFGAKTLLMNRCADENIFKKTVLLINEFKEYFTRHNQTIYENPSPGNKEGGITTLEEKSLGCTQKGGESCVTDVLKYGETAKIPGLNLLNGPGNDIVAVTNLMAAGAQIILFTTGRGTPLGAPVPTVKISSNSALAAQKPHWIDFDAGELLSGTPMTQLAENLFSYILKLASGETLTKNEINGYREISIFKDGVTL
jgi:altronate hydrolase